MQLNFTLFFLRYFRWKYLCNWSPFFLPWFFLFFFFNVEFKIKYLFCLVCQMKLSRQCFWDILFCPTDSNILTKLQLLDLSWNDFNAQVLKSLTAFPSLKTLDLSYNNLEGSFTTKGKLHHWHQGGVVLCFSFNHWHNSRKPL